MKMFAAVAPVSLWCFVAFQIGTASGDDWPRWLGPNGASEWRESGVIKTIPAGGLPVRWRTPVGLGYSGPAVAGGKVYVTDYVKRDGEIVNNPGGRSKLAGSERVLCLDAATGKVEWKHEYDCPYELSYASGQRCTPTISDGLVFTLGAQGHLKCFDADTGRLVWDKNLPAEYKTQAPFWGFAAHPLADEKLLYCLVGGEGSVAVAFDKRTGKEVWRSLSVAEAGYCPPVMIEQAGVRQLLIWHTEALNGLDPDSGKVYWSVPLKPDYGMSVTPPRKLGDLLYASGIGNAAVLVKLGASSPSAEVVWRGVAKQAVYTCNAPPFLIDDMIYGNDCQMGSLIGVRLSDGQRLWETFEPTCGGTRRESHGTAFLVRHADRFFLFSETGDLIVAQLSPEGYQELGRFHVLDPTNECFGRAVVWSHPAFANRSLYARNDKELVCVSLAE